MIEFTRFKPGTVTPSAFALPDICTDGMHRRGERAASVSANMGDAARLASLLPAARLGACAYVQCHIRSRHVTPGVDMWMI